MIVGAALAQLAVYALGVYVLFAFFVAWARYERWIRDRRRRARTGDVVIDPSCSERRRAR